MKHAFQGLLAALLATLAGCALMTNPPVAGTTESEIVAQLGRPTASYQDGNNKLLEYAHGPAGQQTYMARIGTDGKLISYEQVLTAERFGTIKIGEASKDDVLHAIGTPSETSYLSLPKLEVWSYRYKESGVWNSMMHVHFDQAGIVRKLQNGPDPLYDHDGHFHHMFHRM
jgi:hypothetical protein